MKKTIKTIGAVLAVAGVWVAVCTADNSAHEIAMRLGGVVAFLAGVAIHSLASEEAAR